MRGLHHITVEEGQETGNSLQGALLRQIVAPRMHLETPAKMGQAARVSEETRL